MDTELKKRLKGFRETPNREVWDGIDRSLGRRSFAKGVAALVGGVVVIAAIVFSIVEQQPKHDPLLVTKTPVDSVETRDTLQKNTLSVGREDRKGEEVPACAEPQVAPVEEESRHADVDIIDTEVAVESTVVTGEVVATAMAEVSASAPPMSDTAQKTEQGLTGTEKSLHDSVRQAVKTNNYTEGQESMVRMPNVILPNDDNLVNREFKVYANGPVTSYRLCIYNRRGAMVFETTDINSSWDATYKGTPVAGGTYVYVVQYGDKEGKKHVEKGAVSVIR